MDQFHSHVNQNFLPENPNNDDDDNVMPVGDIEGDWLNMC